ncbi:MAG: zinc ribbon domain-containing protein [Chloroflexales bacterium]|nr:zinc ribbon domain-containing protein [Chloroflexales bacterium]
MAGSNGAARFHQGGPLRIGALSAVARAWPACPVRLVALSSSSSAGYLHDRTRPRACAHLLCPRRWPWRRRPALDPSAWAAAPSAARRTRSSTRPGTGCLRWACRSCGAEVGASVKFCPGCGARLEL